MDWCINSYTSNFWYWILYKSDRKLSNLSNVYCRVNSTKPPLYFPFISIILYYVILFFRYLLKFKDYISISFILGARWNVLDVQFPNSMYNKLTINARIFLLFLLYYIILRYIFFRYLLKFKDYISISFILGARWYELDVQFPNSMYDELTINTRIHYDKNSSTNLWILHEQINSFLLSLV